MVTVLLSYQIDSVSYTFEPLDILFTCRVDGVEITPNEPFSLTYDFASNMAPVSFTLEHSNECYNVGKTVMKVYGN